MAWLNRSELADSKEQPLWFLSGRYETRTNFMLGYSLFPSISWMLFLDIRIGGKHKGCSYGIYMANLYILEGSYSYLS